MQENELTTFVIESLAGGEDPDDIIYALCEKAGWTWPKAEAFVLEIQEMHQGQVVKKQFPLLLITAAVTYAAGIGLMAYSLYSILERVRIHRIMGFPAPDVFSSIRLVLDFGFGPVILFVTGAGMVVGSLIGMRDAWKSLLTRD